MLPWLSSPHPSFPSTEQALESPNGLLAAGGELTPAWLVDAYRKGIFPWYSDKDPILWWSPDPRMILLPAQFKRRRSLAKRLRHGGFSVTLDQQFIQVVEACAAPRKNEPGTWINPDMRRAYQRLHELGIAHSIEVHRDGELVGGLYGLAMGPVFFGESMFSRQPDASKIALAYLAGAMQRHGGELIDCQMHTPHLASLGATTVARNTFINYLEQWLPEKAFRLPSSAHQALSVPASPWLAAIPSGAEAE
ncbi:leucyl/phenylalanyl-tRNA--protein transferase [Vreelandella aquamarina]|uniref:Leucyl/phenylalanyl-tRNA--protein transferase n=1 Tax=Vreelandella aquamarina TaxID=77097 RepID=A0A1N6DKC0_9GAMM|nr:leucyl/phenylalanyl-tRNA--protein transferase [Halomonas meridiana]GED44527.1 leucyl/phenylalanyl-tRNA--protein transferase [Halomonas meridiana]SIN61817.1 leucyl/phenylalanyl-tRNA--protein transferase [Halomonas meridiana]SIN71186.1 leucyl/phenylalanyl-tRNA--protein transferase [Halomonas meridiana]SIO24107.1 leucyl/phenylalanyl-tRNA--protein transferase [Halomonas meridiana]